MANISSGMNGPWSAPSTWTGGVVPGVGDNVTLAGHTITVDQDIEVNNMNTTGVGQLELVNSGARTITINGTLAPATTSTASGIISVGESHTGDTVLNISTLTVGAHTANYLSGIVRLFDNSSGSIDANFGTIIGDSHATGIEPSIFYFGGPSSTNLHISANVVNLNQSRLVDHQNSAAFIVSSTITSDITATHNGTHSPTYNLSYPFMGDLIFEETVDPGTATFIIIGNSVSPEREPTVTFMKDLIHSGYYLSGNNNRGTSVVVHGNATNATFTTISSIVIDGDYTYTESGTGISLSTTSGVGVWIKGDLIVTGTGTGVRAVAINNLSDVTIGEPGSDRTHRIEAPMGVAAIGRLILHDGVNYSMPLATDTEWPNFGSDTTTLTNHGQGPLAADVRSGAQYAFALQGSLNMPPKESVRAGVLVDDTAGTALTHISDLSNVTGGQIATLSE